MSDFLLIMKNELVITFIIFLLLFIKLGKGMKNESLLSLIQFLLLLNVGQGFTFSEGNLFGNMFTNTEQIAFEKNILNLGVYLISLFGAAWLKQHKHLPEFFILMLSALLGMNFLISSGNLLMFYLALELSSIPVAAMANFDLEKKISSEAAMKMILSSAFSSGILLFGISLIYGATGTINFAELPLALSQEGTLPILAFVFFFSAFAFKLSVVPFHLWTADVYEGSPVAVTSFLSVISKGSVAFIFISVLYKVFSPLQHMWYNMLVLLSIATMVTGNLFALRQQNLKRFLAFSSIAQVGFILFGISGTSIEAQTAIIYFVLVYVFSNLAAFGVISIVSSATGRETISDFKGFYQHNKFLSWVLALALFSLAGVPPTAGFFGKLFLILAGAKEAYLWFLVIAALNLVVSLYYYLKVVRAIFMDKNDNPIEKINIGASEKLGLIICSAGIVLAGLLSWIYQYIAGL